MIFFAFLLELVDCLKEKDIPKRDIKDQLHFRHSYSMILKEEAWEQKHERNWDRKPTFKRHQKLLLSRIDHCQDGIRAEDKACATRKCPHPTGSLLQDSHCSDWKTVGQKNAEDGTPTFIASAACSFPPAFSLQTGTMTSTWHKV